uniref:5'-tyrosyl-DNA phosphodiesterase n=1 Tax=Romanomermis culicivorax TaxID=13658 RepID=A0A915IT64_ROMCU
MDKISGVKTFSEGEMTAALERMSDENNVMVSDDFFTDQKLGGPCDYHVASHMIEMSADNNTAKQDHDPQECDRKCKEFAEITGTDSACGHFFLQDCDWNLEIMPLKSPISLLFLFAASLIVMSNEIKYNFCFHVALNKFFGTEAIATHSSPIAKPLKELVENPAFVFLQEVVPETLAILDASLTPDFSITAPSSNYNLYFNVLLINTKVARKVSYNVIEFSNTQMMRDLLQVEVEVENKPIVLLTTHLESTKEFKNARMKQFQICMETIRRLPYSKSVIFGGDLNIRDDEVMYITKYAILKFRIVSDKLEDVHDVWEATGSKSKDKFTWDCLQNDNLQKIAENASKFKPRCRFDRLYFSVSSLVFRNSEPKMFDIGDFKLIGKNRIRSCLCFPSDHWALRCAFKVERFNTSASSGNDNYPMLNNASVTLDSINKSS